MLIDALKNDKPLELTLDKTYTSDMTDMDYEEEFAQIEEDDDDSGVYDNVDEEDIVQNLSSSFTKFQIGSSDNESETIMKSLKPNNTESEDEYIEKEFAFNEKSPDYFPKRTMPEINKKIEKLPTLSKSDVGPRAIKPYKVGDVLICTTLTMQDEEESVDFDTTQISKISKIKRKPSKK